MNKEGFTLAEVLVTLTIIGIVAALTIPALIQSTNKNQYVTGLKKAYSVIAQAEQVLIAENGNMSAAITTYGSMMLALKAKLNVAKYCAANTLPGECWHEGTTGWKDLHGDDGWTSFNTKDRMILSDGSLIAQGTAFYSPSCSFTYASEPPPLQSNNCGQIFVDINGFKAPNQAGRDIFIFEITNVGAFVEGQYNYHGDPAVWGFDWFYCNPNTSGSGNGPGCGCTARVLQEGAMNY